jgi:hypothetical protein
MKTIYYSLLLILPLTMIAQAGAAEEQKNVLFLIADDLTEGKSTATNKSASSAASKTKQANARTQNQ